MSEEVFNKFIEIKRIDAYLTDSKVEKCLILDNIKEILYW